MNNAFMMEELLSALGAFIALYGAIFAIAGVWNIVLFVLKGIGLYEMSVKMGLKNPWLSFIPVVSNFSLGRIAQRYVKKDGSASAKFGVILIVLNAVMYILAAIFSIITIIALGKIILSASNAATEDIAMTLEMFYPLIPVIVLYFVLFACAIALNIIWYVAFWRVCAIYENTNATLFTVLSIFFNFLGSIFLFIIRNKEPKFTFEERIQLPSFENTDI